MNITEVLASKPDGLRVLEIAQDGVFVKTIWAVEFIVRHHRNPDGSLIKRKDGTDDVDHMFRVCRECMEICARDESVPHTVRDRLFASLLLHDTPENTAVVKKDIEAAFGSIEAMYVDCLSRKAGEKLDPSTYYSRLGRHLICVLAKSFDKEHVTGTMVGVLPPDRVRAQTKEVEEFLIPLVMASMERWPKFRNILEGRLNRLRDNVNTAKRHLAIVDILMAAETSVNFLLSEYAALLEEYEKARRLA